MEYYEERCVVSSIIDHRKNASVIRDDDYDSEFEPIGVLTNSCRRQAVCRK